MTITGVPKIVWPGRRTSVIMRDEQRAWRTHHLFTWNPWAATLCERAYVTKRPIAIQAEQTPHGWQIAHVELLPPDAPQVAAQ